MLQQQFYKYQVNSVGNLLVLSVQFLLFWSVHDTLGITKKLQIAYTQYDRGTHISDAEIMTFLKLWKAAFVFWNNTLESENEMAVSSKGGVEILKGARVGNLPTNLAILRKRISLY